MNDRKKQIQKHHDTENNHIFCKSLHTPPHLIVLVMALDIPRIAIDRLELVCVLCNF